MAINLIKLLNRHLGILLVLSVAISLCVPLLLAGQEIVTSLKQLSLSALGVGVGMIFLSWVLNAARIKLILSGFGANASLVRMTGIVISSDFAGAATPAATGNIVTYIYLLRKQGQPAGHAAACYATDYAVDLAFFATALPLLLILTAPSPALEHPIGWAIGLLVTMSLAMGLMWWAARHYRRILLALGRLLQRYHQFRRMRRRIARIIIQFRHGVSTLVQMPIHRFVALYIFTVSHWLLRFGALPMFLLLSGEHISYTYLYVAQVFLMLLGQLTFLPGGAGSVELGMAALLMPYLEIGTVATAVLAWRFCTYYWYLLAGAPIFFLVCGKSVFELLVPKRAVSE